MSVLQMNNAQINLHENANDLVTALAERFVALSGAANQAGRKFSVSLSGGSTPKALYELLATDKFSKRIDWTKIMIFLGDERCVPHDHPDSNFGMIKAAMLSKLNIPAENIFPTQGQDKDPEASAKEYDQRMRDAFKEHAGFPQYDLILLGLGPDGHTASLFPDTAALSQKEKAFVANFVPKFQAWRLTLTLPVINNGRNVIFLVAGDSKASIVKDIFESQTKKYPSQLVHPGGDGNSEGKLDGKLDGKLEWYMDKAAAAGLTGG